jgi:hypothetical protein
MTLKSLYVRVVEDGPKSETVALTVEGNKLVGRRH